MKKYKAAVSLIDSSTCINVGTIGLKPSVTMVKNVPMTIVENTACAVMRRAAFTSFAPKERDTNAKKPIPSAEIVEFTSQFIVTVEPTAAVAEVPKVPTIAVSIYCTAVCISCSSIVGRAKVSIRVKVW